VSFLRTIFFGSTAAWLLLLYGIDFTGIESMELSEGRYSDSARKAQLALGVGTGMLLVGRASFTTRACVRAGMERCYLPSNEESVCFTHTHG